MKNYRNNNRRNRFKSNNERNFHNNGNGQKLISDFTSNSNFKRRNLGRNNQNASRLAEKYANLAREAISNGDKILSENYFQHADHFSRIVESKKENFTNATPKTQDTTNNLTLDEKKQTKD